MDEEEEHYLSASHRKCILLSGTDCHIINYLLTELARAVPGQYWPSVVFVRTRCARSLLSRRRANIPQYGPRARLVRGYYYMASSGSGQYAANSVFRLATRAGKMERYCPPGTARFVPANEISPKFKRVHESFLSLKLLSAKVKRLFVISLSLWNQKKRPRE